MRINKLLFTLLLFVPLFSFGIKAPGYLGKKTQIGAYVCYMPDYLSLRDGDTRDYKFNKKSLFMPSLLYNFQGSRVVSNQVDLSLQVGFLRYGITSPNDEIFFQQPILSNGNDAVYSRASGMTYKFIARINRDFQSPLGNYHGYGIAILNQKVEMVDKFENTNELGNVSDVGLCFETGTRRHIGANLILDLGIEATLFINGFSQNSQDLGTSLFKDYSLDMNRKIYARRNIVNFKLGLNYIF
jgi:hypothetical protein